MVLPYINMSPPQVYTYSPSWNPLPLPPHTNPLGRPSAPAPSRGAFFIFSNHPLNVGAFMNLTWSHYLYTLYSLSGKSHLLHWPQIWPVYFLSSKLSLYSRLISSNVYSHLTTYFHLYMIFNMCPNLFKKCFISPLNLLICQSPTCEYITPISMHFWGQNLRDHSSSLSFLHGWCPNCLAMMSNLPQK